MTHQKCLDGKTAIVTGASGILGTGFCRALLEHGAKVVMVDISKTDLKKSEELFCELGFTENILALDKDITNKNQVSEIIEKALNFTGSIEILHNNAATKTSSLGHFFETFEDYSLETWNEVLNVNVTGMFLMSQAVGKVMCEHNKGGSIINTSSIYGMLGADKRIYDGAEYMGLEINTPAIYSTSKAAVIGLTKYLATYWGEKNIRVNSLTPGGIQSGQNSNFIENYSKKVPLNRMGQSNEVEAALVFLASNASSYITGHNLIVDGGFSAW